MLASLCCPWHLDSYVCPSWDARLLVITFDASVHGWTAVLRSSPDEPGVEIVGGYRAAVILLAQTSSTRRRSGVSGSAGVPGSTRLRSLQAGCKPLSELYSLANHTMLIHSDCSGAISALRKGSIHFPALQNNALLHNSLFMNLGTATCPSLAQ